MLPTSSGMTAPSPVLQGWETKPVGKAMRVGLAVLGVLMGTLVFVTSVMGAVGWPFAVIGLAVTGSSVQAARVPSLLRLGALAIALMAIPLLQSL
jgi:hypothetical protein